MKLVRLWNSAVTTNESCIQLVLLFMYFVDIFVIFGRSYMSISSSILNTYCTGLLANEQCGFTFFKQA